MFTYFAVIWLFVVVCDISMCRCNPSRDYIAAHWHRLDRRYHQHTSMPTIVDDWQVLTSHHHNDYSNFDCYYYYYCCVLIVLAALTLYLSSPDSLCATFVPFYFRFWFPSGVVTHEKQNKTDFPRKKKNSFPLVYEQFELSTNKLKLWLCIGACSDRNTVKSSWYPQW